MRKLIIPHEALDRHEKTLGKALLGYLEKLAEGDDLVLCHDDTDEEKKKSPLCLQFSYTMQPCVRKYWNWVYESFRDNHILTATPLTLLQFAKENEQRLERVVWLCGARTNVAQMAKSLFSYEDFRAGKVLLGVESHKKNLWSSDKDEVVKWSSWSLAEFVRLLDVRYCPYCNAETVGIVYPANDGQKESFSAIDHILPKSDYPLLALSLYNLVPACYRCNSQFKGEKDRFDLEHWQKDEPFKAFHSYTHNIHKWFRFDYRPSTVAHLFLKPEDDDSPLSITRKIPLEQSARKGDLQFYFGRTEHHLDDFRLLNSYRDLYSSEINGILKMEMICTPTFIETMKSSYPGMTDEDFNLVFRRTSLDPREINRHRFAKLIIDLHKQIGKDGLFDGETVPKTPEEVQKERDAINENLAEQQARWEERKQKIDAAFRKSYWFMSNNKVTDNG